MMPTELSIAACAILPVMSCLYILESKLIEELKSSAMLSVTPSVRPAHIFAIYFSVMSFLTAAQSTVFIILPAIEHTSASHSVCFSLNLFRLYQLNRTHARDMIKLINTHGTAYCYISGPLLFLVRNVLFR